MGILISPRLVRQILRRCSFTLALNSIQSTNCTAFTNTLWCNVAQTRNLAQSHLKHQILPHELIANLQAALAPDLLIKYTHKMMSAVDSSLRRAFDALLWSELASEASQEAFLGLADESSRR